MTPPSTHISWAGTSQTERGYRPQNYCFLATLAGWRNCIADYAAGGQDGRRGFFAGRNQYSRGAGHGRIVRLQRDTRPHHHSRRIAEEARDVGHVLRDRVAHPSYSQCLGSSLQSSKGMESYGLEHGGFP